MASDIKLNDNSVVVEVVTCIIVVLRQAFPSPIAQKGMGSVGSGTPKMEKLDCGKMLM